jgi:predicted nuclease with TOPRIM domain
LYAESVKDLEEKKQNLDEEISKNMELTKSNQELQREISTRDVCEGLTLTQSEKVRSLSEGVDFVSVEDFGEKLQVIKDNYFPTESVVSVVNEETVAVEETTEESESKTAVSQTDPQVTAIAAAMGRFSKK